MAWTVEEEFNGTRGSWLVARLDISPHTRSPFTFGSTTRRTASTRRIGYQPHEPATDLTDSSVAANALSAVCGERRQAPGLAWPAVARHVSSTSPARWHRCAYASAVATARDGGATSRRARSTRREWANDDSLGEPSTASHDGRIEAGATRDRPRDVLGLSQTRAPCRHRR